MRVRSPPRIQTPPCADPRPRGRAGDGRQGWRGLYGKTDDKVITNFGFGLIIFFTTLVITLSVIQHLLEQAQDPPVAAGAAVRLVP